MRAVLKAQINKTDRNDARGVGRQIMRDGLYRPVHLNDVTQPRRLRMLLIASASCCSLNDDQRIENDLRDALERDFRPLRSA